MARAHRKYGEDEEEVRLIEEALNADAKLLFLYVMAELFPMAKHEQCGMLSGQVKKVLKEGTIDVEVIKRFWETVDT